MSIVQGELFYEIFTANSPRYCAQQVCEFVNENKGRIDVVQNTITCTPTGIFVSAVYYTKVKK